MNVIIIEDETVIRTGMVKHIPWEELEIDDVWTAANAEEAEELCRNSAPDIVISDICMPGISGIDLCKKLRDKFPDLEIIFVTGYDNKEYLKAAIELKVVRYVEKPINRENIIAAVREAVQQVEDKRWQRAAHLHSLFLDSPQLPFYAGDSAMYCAGILHLKDEERLPQLREMIAKTYSPYFKKYGFDLLAELIKPDTLNLLLRCQIEEPEKSKELVKIFEEKMRGILDSDSFWFLTFGYWTKGYENIKQSYQSAAYAQKAISFLGWNSVVTPGDLDTGSHAMELDLTMQDRFEDALFRHNIDNAERMLDTFYKELVNRQVFMNGDIRYYYYSMNHIMDLAEQNFGIELSSQRVTEKFSENHLEQMETFAEMHMYMKDRLKKMTDRMDEHGSAYIVKKVKSYIWENYGTSSLTIGTIAEYVCLTPTYLSNLFKKKTGMTIGQYLVDVRVENAKEYIKDPHLKFYQVAGMVGYEDANYFAKIFKKKTGFTPSEYKESL